MKDTINTSNSSSKIRHWVTSIVVCGIVLIVPVFTLVGFGHFFQGDTSRSGDPLPVMNVRKVDTTTLPVQLFQEPLITVTFDDGFESIYKSAMPLLQKYGIRSTQYVISGQTDDINYVSWEQVEQMQKAGHEIGCHTMNHPDLTTLVDEELEYQIKQCKAELTGRFGPIYNFASPYGSADDRTLNTVSKYFDSQRNTNGDPSNGVNEADMNLASNFDRYNIIGVTVRHDTKKEELEKLVDYAKANNGWIVLTYHQADEGEGSQFAVEPEKLEQQFEYLNKTNVRIVTMQDALRATRLENVEF